MGIVSALICTRDRPEALAHAVDSLLRNESCDLEILVVDQSDGPDTQRAIARFAADSRLRYLRSATRGKGSALNEGLRAARGEVVVCTDDDCEAPAGWVAAMARTLDERPTAAVCFCNVVAPPHDKSLGYVPAYERARSRLIRSTTAFLTGRGLGAGMAVRRNAILDLGGFDEALGPGGIFPSCDDWDIAFRAVLRGWHVYETAELAIVHHGFRTFAQGREHARRDWIAIGAFSTKPLKAGHFSSALIALWEFGAGAVWPPIADLLRFRKPRGLTRILAFLEGFKLGLRTSVDRATLRFVPARPQGPQTEVADAAGATRPEERNSSARR